MCQFPNFQFSPRYWKSSHWPYPDRSCHISLLKRKVTIKKNYLKKVCIAEVIWQKRSLKLNKEKCYYTYIVRLNIDFSTQILIMGRMVLFVLIYSMHIGNTDSLLSNVYDDKILLFFYTFHSAMQVFLHCGGTDSSVSKILTYEVKGHVFEPRQCRLF